MNYNINNSTYTNDINIYKEERDIFHKILILVETHIPFQLYDLLDNTRPNKFCVTISGNCLKEICQKISLDKSLSDKKLVHFSTMLMNTNAYHELPL